MSSDSFFSRIQSWFDASYHGRYLELILAEICKHHPSVVQALMQQAAHLGKLELPRPVLSPEYVFRGSKGLRRADLALYAHPDHDEPIALLEIKYHDKLLPEDGIKPAQIHDYVHWRSQVQGRELLVLSRERLHLDKVRSLTWTEVARLIRRHAKQVRFGGHAH